MSWWLNSIRRKGLGKAMDEVIRKILAEDGHLSCDANQIADDADLYQADLTSHACVDIMLALEDAFGIEFPNEMMRKSTFQSVSALRAAVTTLVGVTGVQ
jgi:acyl carrier protein